LVLKDEFQGSPELPPFQYNARSRRYIKTNYKLDFYFGFENDPSADRILDLFRSVKYRPGLTKGILVVRL
jgi:hypothetical protein